MPGSCIKKGAGWYTERMTTMGENYQGRRCIVTGAARGIGKACAAKFAEYGADVIMVDINRGVLETSAAEIAAQYGVKAYPYVTALRHIHTSWMWAALSPASSLWQKYTTRLGQSMCWQIVPGLPWPSI